MRSSRNYPHTHKNLELRNKINERICSLDSKADLIIQKKEKVT